MSEEPAPRTRKLPSKKRLIIPFLLITALLMSGAIYLIYIRQTAEPAPTFPVSIIEKATFPLYYPTGLPEGFTVDESSIDMSDKALIFTISYGDGSKLIISEQPRPVSLDIEKFHIERFVEPQTYFINDNRIVVGKLLSTITASIPKDTTWIIIKSTENIEYSILAEIGATFTKVE